MTASQHPPMRPLVIITGSSGLIGARLVKRLAGEYFVLGLDVEAADFESGHYTWKYCDLTDDEQVSQVFEKIRAEFGRRVASVFHMAAYYDFSGEPSSLYEELTVKGTERLLGELQQFAVEQFVFTSTLLVAKPTENGHPVTAFSPTQAEWDYPQSKLEAEQLITRRRGNIPTVVLRLAGVYDEMCHSIPLAQQISRIYERQLESYVFPGDSSHGQSFIHLDDTIDCLTTVVAQRKSLPQHELFVIGEEEVMSYADLQDAIGQLVHDQEWTTIRIPKAVAKVGAWVKDKLASREEDAPFIKPWMIDLADQNYPVNMQRARDALHWSPQHSLRGMLPAMVERLKDDPRAWYAANKLPLPEHLKQEERP